MVISSPTTRETDMTHCYTVKHGFDLPLTVFAESADQAASIFLIYRSLKGLEEPAEFSIASGFRGLQDERKREHMRVAMLRREIGIGIYDPEEGFNVFPVIDAAEGGELYPFTPRPG